MTTTGSHGDVTVRASSADRARKCPASVTDQDDGPRVNVATTAADLGSAGHAWFEQIEGIRPDPGELAARFAVPLGQLEYILDRTESLWHRRLKQDFGALPGRTIIREQQMRASMPLDEDGSMLNLTGRLDRGVIDRVEGRVGVLDLKTGQMHDYEQQMRQYMFLYLTLVVTQYGVPMEEIESVHGAIAYPMLNQVETLELPPRELTAWADEMRTAVLNGRDTYNPGTHCDWCPKFRACPGAKAFTDHAISVVRDDDIASVALDVAPNAVGIIGPELARRRRMIKFVEDRCDAFHAALKRVVRDAGSLPSDRDGKVLKLQQYQKSHVSAMRAWAVLCDWFDEGDLDDIVSVSLDAAKKMIVRHAPEGEGAGRVREFLAELNEAKAITKTDHDKLVEGKPDG